jgi:dTDP-4-amino-4,6-dideoxygalactose transaminase
MYDIPFLKPNLVQKDAYSHYLDMIDLSRTYTNYGPLNAALEKRMTDEYFHSVGSVVTANNATIGLMIAISQMKKSGKYALMPSFTFQATPLAAMWCGLEPYFVDISPIDWCMDPQAVEEALLLLGDEVAVVVPYATFGAVMKLDYWEALQRRGIPVVIDAASSLGSYDADDVPFGQGFTGTVIYSLHATKTFGIGEGALIYSADSGTIDSIRQMANFGFDERRESILPGLNGKLSEYAAAVALATLDVLEAKLHIRHTIAQWYEKHLNEHSMFTLGWQTQPCAGNVARQFFPLLCPSGQNNSYYVGKLAEQKIQTRTYFSPSCHRQHAFQRFGRTQLTVTEQLDSQIISLPIWEDMDERHHIKVVVEALANA